MVTGNNRIAELLIKKIEAGLNETEEAELSEWISLSRGNRLLAEEFIIEDNFRKGVKDHWIEERIWNRLQAAIGEEIPVRMVSFNWKKFVAAAAVLVLMGFAGFYFFFKHNQKINPQLAVLDIPAPMTNRATITLSNGNKIFLDSAASGKLAKQDNVQIVKRGDGKIVYNGNAEPKSEMIYNTLFNPRGSDVINITLSDGSQVWLNAESSLKYPVAFKGNERKVEITGEAYFEVAHDKTMPFIVSKGNTSVQVLGTDFNINAYEDDSIIKITLLQGSIKILAERGPQPILKPGEQAIVSKQVHSLIRADLEEVMAWKNGLFDFHNANIKEIMKQLSRWYDVDVSFEGQTTNEKYSGEIGRTLSLNDVLDGLAFTHIKFRIEEGRKRVILP